MSGTYPRILDKLGLGPPVGLESIGGGCIADARIATFRGGENVFVKYSRGGRNGLKPEMFEREAEGLRTLAATATIRVPRVLAVSEQALVLEMISQAPRKPGFFEDFGRRLAGLHAHHGKACGFFHDNFIGRTRQSNQPLGSSWDEAEDPLGACWPEFFLQRRLRFQARLAASNGHGSELEHLLDRAETEIIEILGVAKEPPSLLHGDLWSGNFITDEHGEACLIDPAIHYGHREADLAMTRLFGGFDAAFYAAYDEFLPLVQGHQDRLEIYQLYHVLNHLNLFGGSYLEHSRRTLQKYAR